MVIDHIDLVTKHIYLAEGVREYHPVDDIYKEMRTLRRTNDVLRGFDVPLVASGNEAKGGGKFTPRLAKFCHGWKVVPEDVSHVLYVSGEQITDEGEGGPACFDLESLSSSSKIIIQYEPPLAEVIQVQNDTIDEIQVMVGEAQYQVAGVQETVDVQPTVLSEQHGPGSWEKSIEFKEE